MNNNKGSSIIENLVAVFIFTILALMVCTAFGVGSDVTYKAAVSYNYRGEAFNEIESGTSSSIRVGQITTDGVDGASNSYIGNISINYIYNDDGDIIAFE
ncbi:MAG: prepilin-type N-terminal cleavage/methylation domain-containing protein [Clostridia bacterium]